MAGLHGAVLALYVLRENNHECGRGSFQPLCSMHAPPASFCHNWESASDSEDVPGSILLLADACSAYPMQVSHHGPSLIEKCCTYLREVPTAKRLRQS